MTFASYRKTKNRRPLWGRRYDDGREGRQQCRDSLLSSDRLLGVVLGGFLVAEPGAAGHFHAAFFVNSEALGGDDVAFFDDILNVFGAAFGEFGHVNAREKGPRARKGAVPFILT